MGKKKTIRKALRKYVRKNKVMFAALGGAAAGITVAGIVGTQKAEDILKSVENGVKDFQNTVVEGERPEGHSQKTHL
jgi:hypothetical protein